MGQVPVLAVLVVLAALGAAAPQSQFVSVAPDSYQLRFDTPDGTSRRETGVLKAAGTPDEEWTVLGEYSWVDPAGEVHRTSFVADKDGYRITPPRGGDQPGSGFFLGPGLPVRAALAGR